MTSSFKEQLEEQEKVEMESVQPISIVHRYDTIKQMSEDATKEEAEQIWNILARSLPIHKGYGLAAVQIGIFKRVALVVYKGNIYRLLNTKLIEGRNPCDMHNEGCLSIPDKLVNTERYLDITIQDDELGRISLNSKTDGLLPIIIQHEIDHFNGITILDRKLKPYVKEYNYGRNDPCPECGKKIKKCEHSSKYLL